METNEPVKVVIKIGASSIRKKISGNSEIGQFYTGRIEVLAHEIVSLTGEKVIKPVIVCSGSVLEGAERLCYPEMPDEKIVRQRCAGVGQYRLMNVFDKAFREFGFGGLVSQYLVTSDYFNSPEIIKNIRDTVEDDWSKGIFPIFNHNDKIEPEIRINNPAGGITKIFPDNDTLGAKIAGICGAKTLLILTKDVDGILDNRRRVIPEIRGLEGINKCKELDKDKGKLGTGGIKTKLEAAEMMIKNGGICIISNAENSILAILDNMVTRTMIYG